MQGEIDKIQSMSHDIQNEVCDIETEFNMIKGAVAEALGIARYMFDHPDHFTPTDIEEKAGQIVRLLDGI